MSYKKKDFGFTLVELLMVISIITLFSSMFFSFVGSAKAKSRDAVRLSDMKQIGTAANLYYDDKGVLPGNITDLVAGKYLSAEPKDPKTGESYSFKTVLDDNGKVKSFVAYTTYETNFIKDSNSAVVSQKVGTVTGEVVMGDLCSDTDYPRCTNSDSNDQIVGVTDGHRVGGGGSETPATKNISDCSEAEIALPCPDPMVATPCFCESKIKNINNFSEDQCKNYGFFYNLYWNGTSCLEKDLINYSYISTCQQLQDINLNSSSDYIIIKDIDCSSFGNFTPIGNNYPFSGSLVGNNYKINGLTITNTGLNYSNVGLFSRLSGNVENVDITNGNINGWNSYSGGATTGGIAGLQDSNSKIINSSYSGTLISKWNTGGLVGESNGEISNSYTLGSVTAGYYSSRSGNSYLSLGGLVGLQGSTGIITNSYSGSTVDNTAGYPSCIQQAAGLVGKTLGKVINSYSYGRVYGDNGGGCGQLGLGGLVVKDYTGAFTGTVTDSYWDKQTSTQTVSAGGIGKTTTEMKATSTYSGWDFTNIWTITPGDYPRLR